MALKENLEIDNMASVFENEDPAMIVRWAVEKFPRLSLACSFGAEDVVLLDILHKVSPLTDVFYLDTDLHFEETYETRDKLEEKYGIKFIRVATEHTIEEQALMHGERLWETNPNLCCNIRKVEPLGNVLKNYDAWITGIRRDQAPTRENAQKVEYDVKFGMIKLNPLANWTLEEVWAYIREHRLIYNPLHDRDYPSIGCEKCTRPVRSGEDIRAGRWSEFSKTECGLHK